jgi:hypothetical protein
MSGNEYEPSIERGNAPSASTPMMTLQKAIDLGEYEPEYLSRFPDWQQLSRHVQFQLIRKAIANREYQLVSEWCAVNNVLDFSKKPELRDALRNIEKQQKQLKVDTERLYIEWTK